MSSFGTTLGPRLMGKASSSGRKRSLVLRAIEFFPCFARRAIDFFFVNETVTTSELAVFFKH